MNYSVPTYHLLYYIKLKQLDVEKETLTGWVWTYSWVTFTAKRLNMAPGMIAHVDVKTGKKMVMDNPLTPFSPVKKEIMARLL